MPDSFEHIISRLPHIEHERRYRMREGDLRNRTVPADPRWPMPGSTRTAAPDASPLTKLARAAKGQCIPCGAWLDTEDPARCLNCQLGDTES